MTKAELQAELEKRDLTIRSLQAQLSAARNEKWDRANFEQCVRQLYKLGAKTVSIIRGYTALELIAAGRANNFHGALAYVTRCDQNGFPNKGEMEGKWDRVLMR